MRSLRCASAAIGALGALGVLVVTPAAAQAGTLRSAAHTLTPRAHLLSPQLAPSSVSPGSGSSAGSGGAGTGVAGAAATDAPVASIGPDGLPTALAPVPVPADRVPPPPRRTKAAKGTAGTAPRVVAQPKQHDLVADARVTAGTALIALAVGIMGLVLTRRPKRAAAHHVAPAVASPSPPTAPPAPPAAPPRSAGLPLAPDVHPFADAPTAPVVHPVPRMTPRTTRIGRVRRDRPDGADTIDGLFDRE